MAAINQWTAILEKDAVVAAADLFADYDAEQDYVLINQGGSDMPIKFMVADSAPTAETGGWIDVAKGIAMVAESQQGGELYFLSPIDAQIGILKKNFIDVESAIREINEKIPEGASADNQLVDNDALNEVRGIATSAKHYKGQLGYGADTVATMNAIPVGNLATGDLCGVDETQKTYEWDGAAWTERAAGADAVGDSYDVVCWYGNYMGVTYAGNASASIICRQASPAAYDLIVFRSIPVDNDTIKTVGGKNRVGDQTFAIPEDASKFPSPAALSFKAFWQGCLNKINALFTGLAGKQAAVSAGSPGDLLSYTGTAGIVGAVQQSDLVHASGDETIGGTKTFSAAPALPSASAAPANPSATKPATAAEVAAMTAGFADFTGKFTSFKDMIASLPLGSARVFVIRDMQSWTDHPADIGTITEMHGYVVVGANNSTRATVWLALGVDDRLYEGGVSGSTGDMAWKSLLTSNTAFRTINGLSAKGSGAITVLGPIGIDDGVARIAYRMFMTLGTAGAEAAGSARVTSGNHIRCLFDFYWCFNSNNVITATQYNWLYSANLRMGYVKKADTIEVWIRKNGDAWMMNALPFDTYSTRNLAASAWQTDEPSGFTFFNQLTVNTTAV